MYIKKSYIIVNCECICLYVFNYKYIYIHMGVSKNNGAPKSSILIGFSIISHPFWGTPIFGNTHIYNIVAAFRR